MSRGARGCAGKAAGNRRTPRRYRDQSDSGSRGSVLECATCVALSFARAIQSGYLRAYALLLLMGVAAMALYFLLASS